MPLTRTTRATVAAYALALAGRSRDHLPVPWTASPVMDDCAAFCSHVLWDGKPGPILWVDNFKTAGDGTYVGGATDLAPWDVLLFDWEGNGVGNHVEFMVGDLGNGYITTYGANGSDSRETRYRTRPKRYILGRFRPAWQLTSAPLQHTASRPASTTTTSTPVGDIVDSYRVHIDDGKKKGTYNAFLVNDDTMRCLHLNGTQERYLEDRKVPLQPDIQSPLVLAGYEQVKGRGAKL